MYGVSQAGRPYYKPKDLKKALTHFKGKPRSSSDPMKRSGSATISTSSIAWLKSPPIGSRQAEKAGRRNGGPLG